MRLRIFILLAALSVFSLTERAFSNQLICAKVVRGSDKPPISEELAGKIATVAEMLLAKNDLLSPQILLGLIGQHERALELDRQAEAKLLKTEDIVSVEQIPNTLMNVSESYKVHYKDGTKAIFKPDPTEEVIVRLKEHGFPFPTDSEIDAYRIDRARRFFITPPTVRVVLPDGRRGSLQYWYEFPELLREYGINIVSTEISNLSDVRLKLLDYFILNTDRNYEMSGRNLLRGVLGNVSFDHALSFRDAKDKGDAPDIPIERSPLPITEIMMTIAGRAAGPGYLIDANLHRLHFDLLVETANLDIEAMARLIEHHPKKSQREFRQRLQKAKETAQKVLSILDQLSAEEIANYYVLHQRLLKGLGL